MKNLISINVGFPEKLIPSSKVIEAYNIIFSNIKASTFKLEEWKGYKNNRFNFFEHKFESFDELKDGISKLENLNSITLENEKSEKIYFSFPVNGPTKFLFTTYYKSEIESFIKSTLENIQGFIYILIVNNIDSRCQNATNLRKWKRLNKNIPSYVKILKNPNPNNRLDNQIINTESLPGHTHYMDYGDYLWFGATWQMYFSDIYYKYIPKPLWDGFNECEENTILENGLRKITLYKNPDDYELKENRENQWAFRRQLGIDSIAHELCSGNRIEPKDLPVEITKKDCEKGQTKVIRYMDKKGNLTIPRKAKNKEIKEYLDDGITVVLERIEKA